MADPTTTSATGVTGGASGGQTGLDQALVGAIAAAVQSAVSQATQELQNQIASINDNINKTATDVDSGTVSRSSIDPASPQRRQEAYAELALSNAVSFQSAANALVLRKISQDTDHHGAIPPIAPRSATGPGTNAS